MAMTNEERRLNALTDEEYLNEAKLSGSIFNPHLRLPRPTLAQEAEAAHEEFSKLMNEERKRIQYVVDMENKRITDQWTAEEIQHVCPICLEEIKPVISYETKRSKRPTMMPCCGKLGCSECINDWKRRHSLENTNRLQCFCCRSQIPRNEPNWLPLQAVEEEKSWAIRYLAGCYAVGKAGLEEDPLKAFELYQRAAELGDAQACAKLARRYYNGELEEYEIPKSMELAEKWARKAAEQGDEEGQSILGLVLMGKKTYEVNEEAFHLFSLAAYQGDFSIGRFKLAECYEGLWAHVGGVNCKNDAARKFGFLSLYWYGKAAEVGGDYDALINFVYKLHQTMKIWHIRSHFDVEPLPGCSHLPLAIWAIRHASGIQVEKRFNYRGLVGPFKYWKILCATCGKEAKDIERLKACSRCRVFHYCSKDCQVQHWKDGHKVDCKEHWIEQFFPRVRKARKEKIHLSGNWR